MKFTTTTTLLTTLLATFAGAAPVTRAATKSMMAADTTWTIESMKRVCDSADTSCAWSFTIDTHAGSPTPCSFTVTGSPASQTDQETGVTCGVFTVTTGWSAQFGVGQGFTTLAVVDYATKEIVYPSYKDTQLASGNVVTPDQSYTVQILP